MIDLRSTTPPALQFNRPPTTICNGFTDQNGVWNNGFACPITNFVQYFCCGTDHYRYCCPPDRYVFETSSALDLFDSSSVVQVEKTPSARHQMITRQFEQFQRYFLPIFLLTTTILFLVGIALWFWLYKHKAFYSIGQDEPVVDATSPSQRFSHSSTEV